MPAASRGGGETGSPPALISYISLYNTTEGPGAPPADKTIKTIARELAIPGAGGGEGGRI